MAKAVHNEADLEPRTSRGMAWIGKTLEALATELPIHVECWDWQVDSATGDDEQYCLTIVGKRHKRVAKVFSKQEIDRCLHDKILQQEVRLRLTKILTFLGPSH